MRDLHYFLMVAGMAITGTIAGAWAMSELDPVACTSPSVVDVTAKTTILYKRDRECAWETGKPASMAKDPK